MAGPAVAELEVGGSPAPWAALGLVVAGEHCVIGATTLCFGRPGSGMVGWGLTGLPDGVREVDGLPTRAVDGLSATPGEHPLGAVAVDHVVVRTPDPARTFAALQRVGMVLRRERTAGELRVGFFRHGEAVVEVVGPLTPSPDAGPASLWGLTLVVTDLDAAGAWLGPLAGTPRDAVQPGRRILTVAREAGHGVPLALMDLPDR